MAFDTNAGISAGLTGATAGSVAGPIGAGIGAAAGFVIGGFLGGSNASGNKKQRRTLERKIRRRQDPAYLARRIKEYTPIARQSILESGAANALTQEVQTNISKRGLTGTGIGTALSNAAALAPSNMAGEAARNLATNSINSEIEGIINMGSYNAQDIASLSRQSAGDIATAIAIFRSLKDKGDVKGGQDFNKQFPQNGSFSSGYPSQRPWAPTPYNPNNPSAMGGNPFPLGFPGARGY